MKKAIIHGQTVPIRIDEAMGIVEIYMSYSIGLHIWEGVESFKKSFVIK